MLDFDTGKLTEVARYRRPTRRREYTLLAIVVTLTSLPYVAAFVWAPLHTVTVVCFMAYFQVLLAFATSTSTDTAHAIRFLLSGSNPIGMTGASSLLLGAVDSLFDWNEDAGERRRSPVKSWALTFYKFAMTPIGAVLMLSEYLWDAVPMHRPTLIRHKWNELFALADYHDLICPEKSNDIFYSDLAYARYQRDPMRYQWNRLRAMVFELQHYRIDALHSVGIAETNLFLQNESAAYQTLKRLKLERIEVEVGAYYESNLDRFPFPENLAKRLILNAQPIAHYVRMRQELLPRRVFASAFDESLSGLLREAATGRYRMWTLLRLLDGSPHEASAAVCRHTTQEQLDGMIDEGILSDEGSRFCITDSFRGQFEALLNDHYVLATHSQQEGMMRAAVPNLLTYGPSDYLPKTEQGKLS